MSKTEKPFDSEEKYSEQIEAAWRSLHEQDRSTYQTLYQRMIGRGALLHGYLAGRSDERRLWLEKVGDFPDEEPK